MFDGIYCCFISLTTVGLGDMVPTLNADVAHADLYKYSASRKSQAVLYIERIFNSKFKNSAALMYQISNLKKKMPNLVTWLSIFVCFIPGKLPKLNRKKQQQKLCAKLGTYTKADSLRHSFYHTNL